MKNYLVTAHRDMTRWNAVLYIRESSLNHGEQNTLESAIFDNLANALTSCPDNELTLERISDMSFTTGWLYAETDTEIEQLMRALGFRKCDFCGAWVSPQDVRTEASTYDSRTQKRKCARCIALAEASDTKYKTIDLAHYHHTTHRVRVINGEGENQTLDNVQGIGIEMEYNHGQPTDYEAPHDSKIKCTTDFYKISNNRSRNQIFRCEQDSTVSGEIISNVFTKKALYEFDWNILTEELKLLKNNVKCDKVGFHVHLSKTWLGETAKKQAESFLKLQYVLNAYEKDFFKASGRHKNSVDTYWCNFYTEEEIEQMKNHIQANENPWRYSLGYALPTDHNHALINSGNTIELRIGKSTNDPERIEHYLKLILGIVEHIKSVDFENIFVFRQLFREVPKETMTYWKNHGCFLRTIATETRGVEY